MSKQTTISPAQAKHIAKLANLTLNEGEDEKYAAEFTQALGVVETLLELDTTTTKPTHQVTELENVWREDLVDKNREFTQSQALQNAKSTHNGYIVVERVLSND